MQAGEAVFCLFGIPSECPGNEIELATEFWVNVRTIQALKPYPHIQKSVAMYKFIIA